ncbi:response regulator receiver and ANTAR domain protein [Natranaerovirga hydrolytica]|uniref:Stage 0 sporulation protein A homolog n=1 Tax=Natranaerovirga hydrolytica TaxID=680378 RepID=A0A4R1MK84_9FIRM|nr:ANTAR domain-containing protein [Natranaerovirga hydrolytica]TCK92430.1 response regulator receiver and ANTAR domain protein [Natranaerovirga hydrolytica]
MATRILVGAGKESNLKKLSSFFSNNGYLVVGAVDDGYEFLRRVNSIYPDICVVDGYMKGLNTQDIAEVVIFEKISPIVVLVSEYELQNYAQLNQESLFVPIIKPLNKNMLLNTIDILLKTNRNIQKLEKEVTTLKDGKSEKEVINKAKKLLIDHMCLTEDEAHRRIQKQSMEKGIQKIKIAEAIIMMYE